MAPDRLTVGVAARLSRYLQVLTQAKKMGRDSISSQEIGEYTNVNATQIRRDLSGFGKFGKRGVGYNIDFLIGEIRKILRTSGQHNIVLIGAGSLGQAISKSTDRSPTTASTSPGSSTPTRPRSAPTRATCASRTCRTCRAPIRDRNVIVGVLAVPEEAAQEAADALVARGREDHLQLLRRADRHARRRHRAPVEPGRRDPARALLPSDLRRLSRGRPPDGPVGCGGAARPVARLPARGHRLEHLHAARGAGVGAAGARRASWCARSRGPSGSSWARTCASSAPTSARSCPCSCSTATRASRRATSPT